MRDSSANELKNKMPGDYYKFVENNWQANGAFKIIGDTLKIQRFVSTGQRNGLRQHREVNILDRFY